eukprot:CAMPEP_0206174020 /NCGR_PEP_ID=MMETSP1474-20131121/50845_1 /ASSEMBLY_ACC=CAM_ASM_001110 /TAXON_ID=97495 /ORGANISM="Imantonia sp., Strain RCC918" /LENGTH=108 /DNA_ID=CAMNT_0053583273 /DNA_START=401 /DNA_END=724 /DNA_ORIENTATION=+
MASTQTVIISLVEFDLNFTPYDSDSSAAAEYMELLNPQAMSWRVRTARSERHLRFVFWCDSVAAVSTSENVCSVSDLSPSSSTALDECGVGSIIHLPNGFACVVACFF